MSDLDDIIKSIFHVDDFPEVIKKNVFDKNGNINNFTTRFTLFVVALQRVFYQHFYNNVAKCSPTETWEVLKNPKPFVDQICSSFTEDYKKNILDVFSKEENDSLSGFLPEGLLSLIHKKFVLTAMLTLPNSIINLDPKEKMIYYHMFSGDSFSDEETVPQKLAEIIEEFQKELDRINNSIQDEWQDRTLDAYNKKLLSKELMEFVMAESNKRKVNTDE